jgi:hypothetical protein
MLPRAAERSVTLLLNRANDHGGGSITRDISATKLFRYQCLPPVTSLEQAGSTKDGNMLEMNREMSRWHLPG